MCKICTLLKCTLTWHCMPGFNVTAMHHSIEHSAVTHNGMLPLGLYNTVNTFIPN